MHIAPGQINARSDADGRPLAVGPQKAFALQDAEHFLVEVKVVGGAAGRDRADELRDLALNQLAIPAVARALDGSILHANASCERVRAPARHADDRARPVQTNLAARRNEHALIL